MAITRITRVGNSLGVVIPRDMLRQAGWWQGDVVKLSPVDGQLQLQNITQQKVKPVKETAEFGDAKHQGS